MRIAEIPLNTRTITFLLGIATVICALVQISLGANFFVLLMALLSIACGLYGFWLFGISNILGVVSLSFSCGSLLLAFFAKTILEQPLNSNLYSPSQSFLVLSIYSGLFLLAMICAVWIDVGGPLRPITDIGALRFISYVCFAVGLSTYFFHQFIDKGIGGPEYGGINEFSYLMFFGIAGRTAYITLKSGMQRSLDSVLLLMLVLATVAGLMQNTREYTATPWIIFFITVFFFRKRLPWSYVATLICGTLIYTSLVPFLMVLKYANFGHMRFIEEVHAFEDLAPRLLDGELALEADKFLVVSRGSYLHYFGNKHQNILGRFAAIQQIDPAIAATDASSPMGTDVIVSGLRSLVPHFIEPNKPDPNAFVILSHQGWVSTSGGKYPTLPMAGELYAALGMTGTFLAFPIFLAYMLMMKKIGWNLYGNVFSVFIFGCFSFHMFDWNLAQISGQMLRGFPIFYLAIFGLQRLYLFLMQQKRLDSFVRIASQHK